MENWQEVLRKNSIASLEALADKFGRENFPELDRLRQAADNFEFRISPAMVDLIKSPDDPMWRQYVPSVEELDVVDGIVDSLNEDADSPVPNITHRYPDRALFLVHALHVFREDRDLSAAPGRIDHECRNRQTAGPAPEGPHDLDAGLHRRPEVLRARDLIGHIDVVGPYPGHEQPVHELHHHVGRVVHASEQHGLAAERDTGIGEHTQGGHRGRRQFIGMIEVSIDEERVESLEQGTKLGRDSLG